MRATLLAVLGFSSSIAWAQPARPVKQPAIPAAAAAKIPDAGWLVSYETDGKLVIARITKTGPKELLSVSRGTSSYTGWLDGKTLLHVNVGHDKTIEVTWIVDGVIDAKRTVKHPASVWGLKDDDSVDATGAQRTADGEIWIQRCLQQSGLDCEKSSWLRVDTATTKTAKARPAKAFTFDLPRRAPTVKAPAGYTGKIVKVKSKVNPKLEVTAIECTGPKGKLVWSEESPPIDPAERFAPKQVRWIHATPALFEVEGEFTDPVSQVATVQYVFRDCGALPYNSVAWIGDSAWSYDTRDGDTLHVMVDDMPVAILPGYNLRAPR
jgi:hypothetical protein